MTEQPWPIVWALAGFTRVSTDFFVERLRLADFQDFCPRKPLHSRVPPAVPTTEMGYKGQRNECIHIDTFVKICHIPKA
eukprot:scaffold524989_cov19-Prasinocladus_malaysianus.AAC.1